MLASFVPTVEADDADYRIGESGRADAPGRRGRPRRARHRVRPRHRSSPTPAALDAAAGDVGRDALAGVDGVTAVGEPQSSPTARSAVLVRPRCSASDEDLPDGLADDVGATVAQVARAHPDVRGPGGRATPRSTPRSTSGSARTCTPAEGISLPITLVLMLVAFGALIAAGLPVLLAATQRRGDDRRARAAVAPGARRADRHQHDRADRHGGRRRLLAVLPQARARGAARRALHARRHRDRRRRPPATRSWCPARAVVVAMSGLFLVGDTTFDSLAVGAILVVAVAVLGSITVLPALLAKLGRWVDRPRVPLLWRLNARIGQGGLSRRILGPVVRRPVAALLAVRCSSWWRWPCRRWACGSTPPTSTRCRPRSPRCRRCATSRRRSRPRARSATVVVEAAPADAGRVATALDDLATRAVADRRLRRDPARSPWSRPTAARPCSTS